MQGLSALHLFFQLTIVRSKAKVASSRDLRGVRGSVHPPDEGGTPNEISVNNRTGMGMWITLITPIVELPPFSARHPRFNLAVLNRIFGSQ